MFKIALLPLIIIVALLMGCNTEVAYNSNSGFNGSRDSAAQLLVDTSKVDNINAPIGDNEDWFYFAPQAEGFITLSVFFDNPKGLKATVIILDGFGRTLHAKTTQEDQNIYEFDKFAVKPERHFVAIKCTEGQSDYTLRADFSLPPPIVIIEEIPEPDTSSGTRPVSTKCIPADRCKPGQKCCVVKTVAEDGIGAEEKTVKGTIVLVTPRGGELSDVKISGIGQKNNIKPGAKAYLRGLKRKVDIYACQRTFCNATIKATSEDLVRYDTVDVVIP